LTENHLSQLLTSLAPELDDRELVFCQVDEQLYERLDAIPICLFQEANGISLVLEKNVAEQHLLPYSGIWSMIAFKVHSELSNVGFLAAVTFRLSSSGIRAKPVSGFSEDFLFVPQQDVEQVRLLLKELSAGS
jgi:uncharacterized protein